MVIWYFWTICQRPWNSSLIQTDVKCASVVFSSCQRTSGLLVTFWVMEYLKCDKQLWCIWSWKFDFKGWSLWTGMQLMMLPWYTQSATIGRSTINMQLQGYKFTEILSLYNWAVLDLTWRGIVCPKPYFVFVLAKWASSSYTLQCFTIAG